MHTSFNPSGLSRKEFLKLCSLGLTGLFIPPFRDFQDLMPGLQGRVIDNEITLFDKPAFDAREVKKYWKDMVLPISRVTVGAEEPAYNRIWYLIGDEGYAHSGNIQPVKTLLNQPRPAIPEPGLLMEVSVPFTDAFWGPGNYYPFAYRLYYETTHWIDASVPDEQGNTWYRIQDDKWDVHYYVPGKHLRIIPPEEVTPLSAGVPSNAKHILVDNPKQLVIAYEGDKPVFMARAATGAQFSNGRYRTPAGTHYTFHKRPYRHMAAGNLAYNGYDLPGVPWIAYITEKGVAFHGTYWHNDYGQPRSHGCINLTPQAAKWIYRWTLPEVPFGEQFAYKKFGTRVEVIE
jgi:lipoprotein-anchoring transpeptidase ErfK/SrfK